MVKNSLKFHPESFFIVFKKELVELHRAQTTLMFDTLDASIVRLAKGVRLTQKVLNSHLEGGHGQCLRLLT